MSHRGRLVLFGCIGVTTIGIWYITSDQQREKERMHRAVVVDKARLKEIERQQKELKLAPEVYPGPPPTTSTRQ